MHHNKPMDVLEHNLVACKIVRNTLPLRLAALLHDVGKTETATKTEKGLEFPNHHTKSAIMAKNILQRLRFETTIIKKVVLLIDNHMFYYSPDTPLKNLRKLISKVGWENINDLIDLRVADRIASGFDRAFSSGLKKMISDLEILKKEESDYQIKDLAVSGQDIIDELNMAPGPELGQLLTKLLELVLENPELNTKEQLLEIAKRI